MVETIYVTEQSGLVAAIEACSKKPAVAVDTEFARFNTYYPIVGLVQLYAGEDCYLIDPLAVEDISPLAGLLENQSIVKVLHACSEDIEVFCDCLGVVPAPIFDTQIAAALLGVGFSVGYQKLIQHYLDILVPKEETRSDWLQRPLTKSQLDYAALDVIHLLEVYEIQVAELSKTNRADWVTEECALLAKDIPTQIDPDVYYKKVKNAWRLDRRQLHVFKRLCAWREVMAREKNVPRNRVVDEKSLFQIAALSLQDKRAFSDEGNLHPRQLRQYGDDMVAVIKAANEDPEDLLPAAMEKPASAVNSKLLKSLKGMVDARAESLNVAPEMLAKRRHLEQLIRSQDDQGKCHLPGSLQGWREAVIGQDLLSLVESKI